MESVRSPSLPCCHSGRGKGSSGPTHLFLLQGGKGLVSLYKGCGGSGGTRCHLSLLPPLAQGGLLSWGSTGCTGGGPACLAGSPVLSLSLPRRALPQNLSLQLRQGQPSSQTATPGCLTPPPCLHSSHTKWPDQSHCKGHSNMTVLTRHPVSHVHQEGRGLSPEWAPKTDVLFSNLLFQK